ncbi:type IV pilin PilA [Pseudanabaena sp. lw0831]|uniref:type IV pilin-like G/H family protein n=1 Tax=Pseudanabaena sp. lw0831 TaxID=1357935 RepID=UPI0019163138|nr:type IV pilin-like G/H family protein [Pseudanabaena sp. lw0831]GBO52972.1 type IV pilin PilA [Pseudanabaena sp. lw0831]
MQHTPPKNTSHRWLSQLTIALAIAIGVNTALLASSRNGVAHLDSNAIAAEPIELPAEAKQLIGKWQLTTLNSESEPLTFLFTPEGKLYVINSTQKIAVKAEYQINSVNGQIFLDVFQGSFGSRTTFSINSRGELILQQLFMPGATQRAYASLGNVPAIVGNILMPNILLLTRISNDTKLDANIEFPEAVPLVSLAWQSEAKAYIGGMNRSHQAFFLEKEYFTNKLDELGLGIRSVTENYKYQIIVLDNKKGVQNIALAQKDNLKSYTGLVYTALAADSKELTTISLLCESQKPTRKMPPKFKLTSNPTCPEGYVDLTNR